MTVNLKRLFYPGFNLGVRSRRTLQRFLIREPGIRTLDFGCGNGFFTALAVRRSGSAVGVGFDADQIQRCLEFRPYMGVPEDRLSFAVMRADELERLAERFDQVLCLETLEHVDNDVSTTLWLARLLRPGGLLHITTPDIRYGTWVGALDRHANGGHCRMGYTAERLESLLRSSGLDIAHRGKLGCLGDFLTPLQTWLARLLGGSLPAQGVAFLLVYPLYVSLSCIPVPHAMRMFHYIIGRKDFGAPDSSASASV